MNPYQSSLPLFTCQGHTLFRLSPHVRWLTAFSRVTRVTCVTRHWFPRMCSRSFKFYQIIDDRHIVVFIGRHVVRIFRCQWLVSPGISRFPCHASDTGSTFRRSRSTSCFNKQIFSGNTCTYLSWDPLGVIRGVTVSSHPGAGSEMNFELWQKRNGGTNVAKCLRWNMYVWAM